jgi:hypothetical protein
MPSFIRNLACAMALTTGVAANAAELSPSEIVGELYRLELGPKGDMSGEPLYSFRDAQIQDRLTRLFQRLVMKMEAYERKTGDAILDWDPIADGNGVAPLGVKVEATPPNGGSAEVIARFHIAGGEQHVVVYRFVREGGAWKIDDIVTKSSDLRKDILRGLGQK